MSVSFSQIESYVLRKLYAQPDHKATFAQLAAQCYYPDREILPQLKTLIQKEFVAMDGELYFIPPTVLPFFDTWEID